MTVDPEDPAKNRTKAGVPASDDGLPITVPISSLTQNCTSTTPAEAICVRRISNLSRGGSESSIKSTMRVPVRLLSSAVLASPSVSAARQLISPSSKVVPHPMGRLTKGAQPRLKVIRGARVNAEFLIVEGANYMGRRDDEPIDIDLEELEPPERTWTSRKHAVIYFHDGKLEIEDLNSLNGTFVNRNRVVPGKRHELQINDVVQVGTIQLRLVA
jgi:hypothetical protein